MKLSAPIYRLKRKAKLLSRDEKIPLHAALDRIASKKASPGWSLLAAKRTATAPAGKLFFPVGARRHGSGGSAAGPRQKRW